MANHPNFAAKVAQVLDKFRATPNVSGLDQKDDPLAENDLRSDEPDSGILLTRLDRVLETDARKVDFLQARKMETLGRLAGGMVHDLNNLLSVILGYGEILLRRLPNDPELREGVEEIIKAGQRGTELTQHLLGFSRQQPLPLQPVNLNEVLSELQRPLRRLIREDIQLNLHLDPHCRWILAEKTRLEQIIFNLVLNARDALVGPGNISLRTSHVEVPAPLAESSGCSAGFTLLRVADDGYGMSPETQARVFEQFFTTKETGTGLGLATVQTLVKDLGGFVELVSSPGQGSCFHLFFPALADQQVEPSHHQPFAGMPGGTESILVAEDEEGLRSLLGTLLQALGYQVSLCQDGTEAVAKFQSQPGLVDLVVSDLVMPGRTGSEIERELRALNPDLKCLWISGYVEDLPTHFLKEDSRQGFLQKPFTSSELAWKIRDLLDRR